MNEENQEAAEKAGSEHMQITTTVDARLDYTCTALINWFNVVAAQETTNQTNARADLIVDGKVLLADLPATLLLGLETKLKLIRAMYEAMPTLPPGVLWEPDSVDKGVFNTKHPEIRAKTIKKPQFVIMDGATKEHKAQIKEWVADEVIGKFTTTSSSGMITSARKSEILTRFDKLVSATKQARQRANNVDIAANTKIGTTIFDYVNK